MLLGLLPLSRCFHDLPLLPREGSSSPAALNCLIWLSLDCGWKNFVDQRPMTTRLSLSPRKLYRNLPVAEIYTSYPCALNVFVFIAVYLREHLELLMGSRERGPYFELKL